MGLKLELDHINIRTANLNEMIAFYSRVLSMKPGARPPFGGSKGAWLYAEDKVANDLETVRNDYRAAWVHLVNVDLTKPEQNNLQIEHFAFRATGMAGFLARLTADGCPFELKEMSDVGLVQVNLRDPDNNHIHVDFPLNEYQTQQ